MTNVIHVRSAPGWFSRSTDEEQNGYIYIGRPFLFGNPVIINHRCRYCGTNHAVPGSTLNCYYIYLFDRLTCDDDFAQRFLTLKDKILVCYCKPNPCHGDVIAAVLDGKDISCFVGK